MSGPGPRAGEGWAVVGDMSMDTAGDLLAQSTRLWEDGAQARVDLAGVGRIDSSALAVLLELAREAARRRRTLSVVNVPAALLAMADLCGVSEHLPLTGAQP